MTLAIVDIETAPNPNAPHEAFDPESVKTGNLKDPVKIAEKIQEAEIVHARRCRDKAALAPETATICAIGLHLPGEKPLVWAGPESCLLEDFWQYWRTGFVWSFGFFSGNNGRGKFDARHLIVRSWANGIAVPEDALDMSPRGRWLDLAERYLVGADHGSFISANNTAKALGLIGRDLGWAVVRDKDSLEVKGATFHETLKTDPDAAVDYLRNDLAIERAIADAICH